MPTRLPVMAPGEAVWAIVCATLVRDTQAMLPEPDDEPTPEDDDEPEDEPEHEPEDESDDDDEPEDEPGTLYFGQEDGWTADPAEVPPSRPTHSAERTPQASPTQRSPLRRLPLLAGWP